MKYTLIDTTGMRREFDETNFMDLKMSGWRDAHDLFRPATIHRMKEFFKTREKPPLSYGKAMIYAEECLAAFAADTIEHRVTNCGLFEMDGEIVPLFQAGNGRTAIVDGVSKFRVIG